MNQMSFVLITLLATNYELFLVRRESSSVDCLLSISGREI